MDQQTRFIGRAWRAYLATDGANAEQPDSSDSGEYIDAKERRYVVLVNGERVVAVYRIKRNGALRRMKRWPPILMGRASAPLTPKPINHQTKQSESHV